MSEELLSTKRAAEMLGLSVGTLKLWRKKDRKWLRYYRIGGLIKYKRSEIDAYIASCVEVGRVKGEERGAA